MAIDPHGMSRTYEANLQPIVGPSHNKRLPEVAGGLVKTLARNRGMGDRHGETISRHTWA
jgi:hypothetical protein